MQLTSITPISAEDLRRLHPRAIDDPRLIGELLHQLAARGSQLWRSTNRFSDRETAWITEITDDEFVIETENFTIRSETHLFLNFEINGQPYFTSAPLLARLGEYKIRLGLPAVVYQAERRDRLRTSIRRAAVRLVPSGGTSLVVPLADFSPDGLAVEVPSDLAIDLGSWVQVFPSESSRLPAWNGGYAEVRHVGPSRVDGARRVGLSLTRERPSSAVRLEPLALRREINSTAAMYRSPGPLLGSSVPLVRYFNPQGEAICAIADSYGDARNATAVVIPPAWGRTKETLLPLAATILETFRSIGEPIVVVRFDGIRKRGESHLDPATRQPGLENLHFTFSQGARDIMATLDFLDGSWLCPEKTILITFSVSSIEGRRAMAIAGDRVAGWISVVGSADAQSLTRVISGGVDFFGGAERGVKFGYQEIQGLLVDMDRAAEDALETKLAFLDDSRRDFARISAPVTWIHGRDDAWMDLERVKHVLQFGATGNRKILVAPTGHQLRTSEEAMATFELIAQEVGLMALGKRIVPRRPDPFDLADRAQAERTRLERPRIDLRKFWRDYLVGRSSGAGMALVASTAPYRTLMSTQVEALSLRSGQSIADLGCGIGSFASHVLETLGDLDDLRIISIDYVRDALDTGRQRCLSRRSRTSNLLTWVQASLDVATASSFVPIRSESQDSVLLSLVINYVPSPGALLREVHRILRPGGRLVLSSLKRDADISGICVDAVSELRRGRGREIFGEEGERKLGQALQSFISDASRLLDLEEAGLFHFWNEGELLAMMEAAGFNIERRSRGLGAAPQAHVVVATR